MSTGAHRFPERAEDKIIVAKSIVQAVLATHDSAHEPENYDIHWPLSMAIDLLEQATLQMDREESA